MANFVERKKIIVITGAAGFIGMNLTLRLLQDDRNKIYAIDNLITSKSPYTHAACHAFLEAKTASGQYVFVQEDVVAFADGWIPEDTVDEVYHLASIASPPKYQQYPMETIEVNTQGTRNMLDLAVEKGGAKFLLTSTSEVYGDPLEHPQRESYYGNVNPMGPRSCYDESKRLAETYVYEYRRKFPAFADRLKVCRIFNTYGPYMDFGDGRVITNMIRQVRDGEPITIYGDGTQTRSFCYIDDMVEALVAFMAHEGPEQGPMNLGNPFTECSMVDLAKIVESIAGRPLGIVHLEKTQNDPLVRRPDIRLAQRTIGFSPSIELEEGLRRTMQYGNLSDDLLIDHLGDPSERHPRIQSDLS